MHTSTDQPSVEGPIEWTTDESASIEEICSRYPTRRSAALPLLWMAQRKWGWLPLDVLRLVAKSLELPPSEVLAVASFYSMLKKEPTGGYLIQVCHTLPCQLRGSDQIIDHLKDRLGIKEGETTEDGKFTLMRVECLASCGSAPMMQVNDDYHELLTPQGIDEILEALRNDTPETIKRPALEQWKWNRES